MKASRKPSTRLALSLSVPALAFVLSGPARADEILDVDRSALVASTSAEQFALLGGVFLILGGAFVFAPQIVSGVNGFFARLFGRPRKVKSAPQPEAAASQVRPPFGPGAEPHDVPVEGHEEWAPDPEPAPGQAVSRLRDEISSAWGRQGDS